MKDSKTNHGLFVRGAGTCVTATNCKFTGNGMSGVAVLAQVCFTISSWNGNTVSRWIAFRVESRHGLYLPS